MKSHRGLISCVLMCGLWSLAGSARAATLSCTISSPGWVSSYFTTTGTNTTTTSSVTVNCSCTGTGNPACPTSLRLRANYGVNGGSATNRKAKRTTGTTTMNYNEYQNSTYTTVWGNTNALSITLTPTWPTYTAYVPYYPSITSLQGVAAGTYTDTITMQLLMVGGGGGTVATAPHPVTIIVNPVCTVTNPGTLSFSYASFQAAAATASTSFTVNCTASVPYTAGLDAYAATDTTTNVAYTLNVGQTIKPAGAVYTAGAPLSATGSGAAQSISIDGSVAAGQPGKCASGSCSGSTTRTLTISY
jgi:spore coat protein U-like protein